MNDEQPDESEAIAKSLLRTATSGALATIDTSGGPFASFVNVATSQSGSPILLLSTLAFHTRNLHRDRRASLLLVDDAKSDGDPATTGRLSLSGHISVPSPDSDDGRAIRRRYLARHSDAAGYADFADFDFHLLTVERAHLVAGFGRIAALGADDILTDCRGCDELIAAEPDLLDWLNNTGRQAVAKYFSNAEKTSIQGGWRATGIDPDGADFAGPGGRRRIEFARRMQNGEAVRTGLAALLGLRT